MSLHHPDYQGGKLSYILKVVHSKSVLVSLVFAVVLTICLRFLRATLVDTPEPIVGMVDIFTLVFTFVLVSVFMRILASALDHYLSQVENEFTRGAEMTQRFNEVSIFGLSKITEARDISTAAHTKRMGELCYVIAKQLLSHSEYKKYMTEQYCQDLKIAAPLHDIGKVGLPDDILYNESSLSEAEFERMKMHVIIGGDLIAELQKSLPYRTYYTLAKEIAYHHHQHFDGNGYPNVLKTDKGDTFFIQEGVGESLKGKDIPLSARIVALADAYDALVSRRAYKEANTHENAVQVIRAQRGKQFDPDVVDAFMVIHHELEMIIEGVQP